VETFRFVLRASRYVLDLALRDPQIPKLRAHRGTKVYVGLESYRPDDDRRRRTAASSLEPLGDIATDLEATSAYARTDGSDKRTSAERRDGSGYDLGDYAAPPSMDSRHVAAAGVGHKQRDAIGHPHADCCGVGSACDDRIGLCFRRCIRPNHAPSVHLLDLDDAVSAQERVQLDVPCIAGRKCMGDSLRSKQLRAQKHGGSRGGLKRVREQKPDGFFAHS
jgi:hypothetical protein